MLKGKGHLFLFYTIGPLCSHPATSSMTSGGLCLYNRDTGLAVHSVLEFILESSLVTIQFLTKISLGLKEIKLLANSTAQLIICFEIIEDYGFNLLSYYILSLFMFNLSLREQSNQPYFTGLAFPIRSTFTT